MMSLTRSARRTSSSKAQNGEAETETNGNDDGEIAGVAGKNINSAGGVRGILALHARRPQTFRWGRRCDPREME